MHGLYALAAAGAAQDPPLIDLDSTVFLQLAIFLIVAVAMNRFLFQPYLAVRVAREEGIEGAREEARRMEEESRARTADYEAKIAAARHKASLERQAIRTEATARERDIAAQAEREAQATLERSRAELARSEQAARTALAARTNELAGAIVKRVLGREVA